MSGIKTFIIPLGESIVMSFYMAIEHWLTKIEIGLIIFFAGFVIAKLVGRLLKRFLAEAELNRILESAGFKPLSNVIAVIVEYFIYVATLFVILQQFGLTKLVLGIIVVLAFIVLALSFFLAVRDFVPNVVAGFFLRKRMKPLLQKYVQIGSVKGKLVSFGLVGSILKDKEHYYVPHLYASRQKIVSH